MANMIHSKLVTPRIFPWNSARVPEQINRAQNIGGDLTLNRTKEYEIGRVGKLGTKQETPSLAYSMTQFEYGNMEFYRSLANLTNPASAGLDNTVDLDDVKTKKFDISAYLTDDDNIFTGTIWFPRLRISGFTLDIGDPDAIVQRSFNLVGEDYLILDEKYFAYDSAVAGGDGELTITLDPVPIAYALGKYIFRVLRVRAGVVTELEEDVSSAYADNSYRYVTGDVIVQDCLTGDLVKVYYPSDTAYDTLWANDEVSEDFLQASYCEIYIKVGSSTRVYLLQSIGIDVALERTDYKEIGNATVVLTGSKSETVTISLDRFNGNNSLETILAGNPAYPYINPRDFVDNIQIMVKIFKEKEHENFMIGYLMKDLSPTTLGVSQAVEDYGKKTNKLEGASLIITDDLNECIFS
jgi:hypothetical protein